MKVPYFALKDSVTRSELRGGNDLFNIMLAVFAYGEAVVLVLGGPLRWHGEAFTVARQVPFSPYSWAAALALGATLFAAGAGMYDGQDEDARWGVRAWLIVSGAFLCAVWCFALSSCLFLSGQIYPDQVSYSGTWQWIIFGLMYMTKVGQHLDFKVWTRTSS